MSGINITGTLVPASPTFPIANASDLAGGSAQFANEAAIGAVDASRLVIGQAAFSQSSGITYQLASLTPAGGFANGTWQPVTTPAGGSWSPGADTVATANIALTGEQTINGVTTSGSRVLVVGQTTSSANGIYTSFAGAWSRTADANTAGAFVLGKTIPVLGGTFAGTIYVDNLVPTTLGSDPITFVANSPGAGSATMGGDITGTTTSAKVVAITGPAANAQMPIAAASTDWTPSGVSNIDVSTTPYAVQTTTNAVTTIATIPTAAGFVYRIDAQVQTRPNAANDYVSNTHYGSFQNVAGTLTQQGTTINGTATGTTAGKAWPGLTMTLSGTSILVQVAGAAATTINWRTILRITRTN